MTPGEFPNDFELITAMQQAKARAEDFQRHQDAVAGRETGYGGKHHHRDKANAMDARRRQQAGQFSALEIALQNPEYAARYNEVFELLNRAETATEAALVNAGRDLEQAKIELGDTLENANTLPDGTKVFRSADGKVYTEEGRVVGEEEAAGIHWREGTASFEDHQQQRKAVDTLAERIERLRRYQVDVLGRSRDRLNDKDNPPSEDDLDEIGKDVKAGLDEVMNHEAADTANHDSNAPEKSSGIAVPDLGG